MFSAKRAAARAAIPMVTGDYREENDDDGVAHERGLVLRDAAYTKMVQWVNSLTEAQFPELENDAERAAAIRFLRRQVMAVPYADLVPPFTYGLIRDYDEHRTGQAPVDSCDRDTVDDDDDDDCPIESVGGGEED